MAKKKYIDHKRMQQQLFQRTEGYAAKVRTIYQGALSEIINLVKGTELEDGKPFSFSEYGYSDSVTPILRNMYSQTYQTIRGGVGKEWMISNENNDALVKAIFGEKSIEDNHFARFFQRNMEAMDAFFARKTGDEGLSLSQKVWRYTGAYKEELEKALDLAIGEGTPAMQLASKIKQYLNDPDRFYRRFRVKIGEDEDGNPIWGRKWKRRIFDKESGSYKWIDDNPKNYHPGKGVYRSSARNAQRLARTETNIAYRTADFTRWQQLPFVIGVEIKLSNNHPCDDICDDLKGIYPKDFKWTGWHPNCRCYMVPVLAKEEDVDEMLDKILEGEDPASVEISDVVTDMPDQFKGWIKDNEERYTQAEEKGTLPYFIRDNKKAVERILKPLTPEEQHYQKLVSKYGESAVKSLYDAFAAFKDKISNGDLPYQIKKLKFESKWVADKNKFPTSPEMVKMLNAELAKVEALYDHQLAVEAANQILGFKSKSKPLNEMLAELNAAIANGATATEIRTLTAKANAKIQEIEKARLAKLAKSAGGDGSVIDLYATAEEKVELARLQEMYDIDMEIFGNQWDHHVNESYMKLADYKKELARKYISKQGRLVKLNGETDEIAKQALEEYLEAPFNTSANTPVGGRFQLSQHCQEKSAISAYSKETGISEDELGLINRYSYGSKWINLYSYGVRDAFHGGVVFDYGGLCQKYIPATNSVLEKLPRYNGTVFSGISFDSATLSSYISEMQSCLSAGKPYVNKALMSSTTNINKTSIFGDNLMLVIKSKKGADIKAISHYASEDEIVFRAGSRFNVIKVYQETEQKFGFGRGWVVELEEI
nr:MAG TPA: minor capsid protein [Caudoviricetes sp.]